MKNKKSQISVFMIVGIVIFIISLITLYLIFGTRNRNLESEVDPFSLVKSDEIYLRQYLTNCIKNKGIEILSLSANRGGLIYSEDYLSTEYFDINFYYKNGEYSFPELSEIQEQISSSMELAIPFCVRGFAGYKILELEYSYGEPKVMTRVFQDYVRFNVDYPIKIKDNYKEKTINPEAVIINIPFGDFFEKSKEIAEFSINNRNNINPEYLKSTNLYVSIIPHNTTTTIYSLSLNNQNETDLLFNWFFAIEFPSVYENQAPRILNQDYNLIATIGNEFYYKIEAYDPENDPITFSDDFLFFDVDRLTGEINFTPTPLMEGTYLFTVYVSDNDKTTIKKFQLDIIQNEELT